MKTIISIFTAVLLIVVSNYANATADVTDTFVQLKPRATNGAKDKGVMDSADDEDSAPVVVKSKNVTPADLNSYEEKTVDDHVVQFRRGNKLITLVPLRDFHTNAERKEAFEVSQLFAEKLMKVWLRKTLNIRYGDNQELIQSELTKLSAEQIKNAIEKKEGMPTAREIIAASQDAADALRKLKDRSKFLVDFDDLITAYDLNQDLINEQSGATAFAKRALPSAFMFTVSFKVPDQLLAAIKSVRFVGTGLSILLKGHINFTITVRPWKRVIRDLDTGKVVTDMYYETAPHAWIIKDVRTNALNISVPVRIGAGLILGDFNRLSDLTGAVVGISKNFSPKKMIMSGALAIPSYWTVKTGVITNGKEVKNTYLTLTRQFGHKSDVSSHITGDAGGIFNISKITDKMSLKTDSLEDLLKMIEEEVPGSTVKITRDQVDITIPAGTTLPAPTTETLPNPVDPLPSKDQDHVR